MPMTLEPGITPMQRFLDLSHLDGSEYDMVISVLDDEGTVIARRVSVIRLRQPTGKVG